jgi:DNA-binding LacI/PurR family transcriptional regulator
MSANDQNKRRTKSITMKDIADALGLDRTTVSKALSGKRGLSEKTRRLVLETAEKMGYRKDVFASGLMTRKNQIIGMVVTDLSRGLFSAVVREFQNEVKQHGYGVILCSLDNTEDGRATNIEQLHSLRFQRVSGITFVSNGTTQIPENYFKEFVDNDILFNTLELSMHIEGIDQLYFNHRKAGKELTEYLISLGHRKIAFLTYSPRLQVYQSTRERIRGYFDAMREAGLAPITFFEESRYSKTYGHEVQMAYDVLRSHWNREDPPTAVIGANDSFALGILHALKDMGYRIPDDVSVAGFDDLYAEMGVPSLTSMKMPMGHAGQLAARLLMNRIKGAQAARPAEKLTIDYSIVVRNSTGPVRQ